MSTGSVMDTPLVAKTMRVMRKIQSFFCIILALSTASLVVIQVFLRYVFKAPLMGIEELLLFPAIWLYMLGGANASSENTHIECGILTLYLKRPRTIQFFQAMKYLISVLVSSWLFYWAYWFLGYSLRTHKTSALLRIPLIIGESAMFVGLFLMTLYALVRCVDSVSILFRSDMREIEMEKI